MRGYMCYTVVKAGFLKSAFRYVRLRSGSSVTSSSLNIVFESPEQPKKVVSLFYHGPEMIMQRSKEERSQQQ